MNEYKKICCNPWCKGQFTYTDNDIKNINDVEIHPSQCKKCISFNTELSGGIDWVDKEYEGSRYDDMPHAIKYKVTNYKF